MVTLREKCRLNHRNHGFSQHDDTPLMPAGLFCILARISCRNHACKSRIFYLGQVFGKLPVVDANSQYI